VGLKILLKIPGGKSCTCFFNQYCTLTIGRQTTLAQTRDIMSRLKRRKTLVSERECLPKNTDYIEGLVVYAGHESKAMLNNKGPRYKRSKLESRSTWSDLLEPLWTGFLAFWTFIIILQIIIPLSLYVTIEMTKISQVWLIHNNPLMWDKVHEKRVECRALNITEELGQVQYMFCDKTGTLTESDGHQEVQHRRLPPSCQQCRQQQLSLREQTTLTPAPPPWQKQSRTRDQGFSTSDLSPRSRSSARKDRQYPSEGTDKENNHDIGYNFERKVARQVSSWQKKLLLVPPSVPGTAGHPTWELPDRWISGPGAEGGEGRSPCAHLIPTPTLCFAAFHYINMTFGQIYIFKAYSDLLRCSDTHWVHWIAETLEVVSTEH